MGASLGKVGVLLSMVVIVSVIGGWMWMRIWREQAEGRRIVRASTSGARGGGVGRDTKEHEKMKRDHEYKIATMQSRIAVLEHDYLGWKGEREKWENKWLEGEERVRVMGEELVGLRRVSCLFFPSFFSRPPLPPRSVPPSFPLITRVTNPRVLPPHF